MNATAAETLRDEMELAAARLDEVKQVRAQRREETDAAARAVREAERLAGVADTATERERDLVRSDAVTTARADLRRLSRPDPTTEREYTDAADAFQRARARYQRAVQHELHEDSLGTLTEMSPVVERLYQHCDRLDELATERRLTTGLDGLQVPEERQLREALRVVATTIGIEHRESPSVRADHEELRRTAPERARREAERNEAWERFVVANNNGGRSLEEVKAAIERGSRGGRQRLSEERGERRMDERAKQAARERAEQASKKSGDLLREFEAL